MHRLLWVFVAVCTPVVSLQAGLLVNGDFNAGDFSGWWNWAADADNQNAEIEPGIGFSYDGSPNARLFSASSASLMIKAVDWTTVYFDTVDISIIPEPATLLFLGLGGWVLRRKT